MSPPACWHEPPWKAIFQNTWHYNLLFGPLTFTAIPKVQYIFHSDSSITYHDIFFNLERYCVVFVTLQSSPAKVTFLPPHFPQTGPPAIATFKEIYLTFFIYIKYRSAWFTTELCTTLIPEVLRKYTTNVL